MSLVYLLQMSFQIILVLWWKCTIVAGKWLHFSLTNSKFVFTYKSKISFRLGELPILLSSYPPILLSSYPPIPILLSSYPPILLSSHPPILLSSYPPILLSSYPPILLSSYPPILLSSYPPILLSNSKLVLLVVLSLTPLLIPVGYHWIVGSLVTPLFGNWNTSGH